MTTPTQHTLHSRLLHKNQDAAREEISQFKEDLTRYRFGQLLHQYDHTHIDEDDTTSYSYSALPVEMELSALLKGHNRHLFLHNILYHLQWTGKTIPTALIPDIMSWIADLPDLWHPLYRQHPDLTLALSQGRKEWHYLARAFEPTIELVMGSPGYYEALMGRMHLLPHRTSDYIRSIFSDANPHQQARLIEILAIDPSPENIEFIASHLHHPRKPVRQASLAFCVRQKTEPIFGPLLSAMIHQLSIADLNDDFDVRIDIPNRWKELGALANQVSKMDIVTALTDPDDYLNVGTRSRKQLHRPAVIQAAVMHRSQKTLYALGRKNIDLVLNPTFAAALNAEAAKALLKHMTDEPGFTFGEESIQLLKRAHPFLSEEISQKLWAKFVEQWRNLPIMLEDLELEILALRIHPNNIRMVWQHPVFQESPDALHEVRKILKNRMAFLKKCYG